MQFIPEKKFGFGLMRLPRLDPNDAKAVDVEQVKQMVDAFLEAGFTYFDTAWMYHGFASETMTKTALVDRHPRESFTLATKLHSAYLKTKEDRDRIFFEQLKKTGAGYFDYYLLHGIQASTLPAYEELDCFAWLQEKKAQGLVKHGGISFHDNAELLDRILTEHPELEFVQLQLNYLDWESPWIQSRACYEVTEKHGKPVVVMEPVKGGSLAKLPEAAEKLFAEHDPNRSVASWGIRFAASLPNVMMVLSGMSSPAQMQDTLQTMADLQPLTEEERELCFRAAQIINDQIAVPCTGCSYCTEGCPMNIAIPQYFSIYNEDMREDMEHKGWTATFNVFKALTREFGKPSDCVGCGQCEAVCPQHLTIIDFLKDVAAHYER